MFAQKGFTLVELLVVITIIAILSVIGITIFTGVQKSARDAKRRGDVDSIAKAMEVHFGETRVGWYAPLKDSYFASGKIPVDPKNAALRIVLADSATVIIQEVWMRQQVLSIFQVHQVVVPQET